jgi:hypothetical protein
MSACLIIGPPVAAWLEIRPRKIGASAADDVADGAARVAIVQEPWGNVSKQENRHGWLGLET